MPFCPKCNSEYIDGTENCPQCGEQLPYEDLDSNSDDEVYVDDDDDDDDGDGDVIDTDTDEDEDEETFLISVDEGFSANIIEGNLQSANIPYIKKGHSGPAGFLRYDKKYSSLGADFYVPSSFLERANEALPPEFSAKNNPDNAADYDGDINSAGNELENAHNDNSDFDQNSVEDVRHGSLLRTVGGILFFIVAALLIFGVDYIMNIIRAMLGYK